MPDALPDTATLEDIQYAIYVRERVESGRREAEEGLVIDQDDIEVRIKQWLEEDREDIAHSNS